MRLIPIKIDKPIKPGDDIVEILINTLKNQRIKPKDGDIIAIALKVISTSKNSFIELDCKPSRETLEISKKFAIDPCIADEIIKEKAVIIGGTKGVVATIYKGHMIGNIGIDRKNSFRGMPVKWPSDIEREAHRIRKKIIELLGVKLGVIIVDSRVTPLRRGTTGFTISISGFKPIRRYIGMKDIFGRKIKYTQQNLADDLAAAAHIYMGEGDELIPFVYIEDPPIDVSEDASVEDIKVPINECIYLSQLINRDTSKVM